MTQVENCHRIQTLWPALRVISTLEENDRCNEGLAEILRHAGTVYEIETSGATLIGVEAPPASDPLTDPQRRPAAVLTLG
jgi:hypothetical protein